MSVQSADLSLTHRFSYRWEKGDLAHVEKNGRKVFSLFSCGGGSSFGYKLAGYDVIGNVEIDPKMNAAYCANHNPRYNYEMDIRDFAEIENLPEDLYDLDILDGSPPCSSFSLAGEREKGWNKEKRFREGQKLQTLDDLFFEYIKVAKRLMPKVIVAENVKGLLAGNAKGYVNAILNELKNIGYEVQIFLLNAASMGVPQKRERTFIIARRRDLKLQKLVLSYNEAPIFFAEFAGNGGKLLGEKTMAYKRWKERNGKDRSVGDTVKRTEKGKVSVFTMPYVRMSEVPRTLTAGTRPIRFDKPCYAGDDDIIYMSSFPEDYDFCGNDPCYICGMSVPPVMMANIATEIHRQWFKGR